MQPVRLCSMCLHDHAAAIRVYIWQPLRVVCDHRVILGEWKAVPTRVVGTILGTNCRFHVISVFKVSGSPNRSTSPNLK